jgi:threonyl-tRNA synthetase
LDAGHEKIGHKIRAAEVQKIPYMIIVGAKEAEMNSVSVRKHKAGDLGSMTREKFIATIKDDIRTKRLS